MRPLARIGVLVIVLALACPSPGWPWGATGHRAVGVVAESLLTPKARAGVAELLGAGVGLAQVSTWADEVRPDRPETAAWHYVNIPRDATRYRAERDCPQGCVVSAITHFSAILTDQGKPRSDRQEALRWLVHLVADVHQPLHVADDHDAGGNQVTVRFFGVPSNLHRVWDGDILDRAYPDAGRLPSRVAAIVESADRKAWRKGSPAQWAMEAHAYAKRVAYAISASAELDDVYVSKALPVIHELLAKAAVRLAWLLNRAFR